MTCCVALRPVLDESAASLDRRAGASGWVQGVSRVVLLGVMGGLLVLLSGSAGLPRPDAAAGLITSQQPGLKPWVQPPRWFAGKILHWTEEDYIWMRPGMDPQNGQVVMGDIWERIGADGLPTLVLARYTFADGELDQATRITRTTTTSVYGPAYAAERHPPAAPPNPRWCVVQGPLIVEGADSPAAYTDYLAGLLPSFADEAVLARYGFTMRRGSSPLHPLPITPPLAGVAPQQIVSTGEMLRQ